MKWKLATVLFLTLAIFASGASAEVYRFTVNGTGDGSTWANAMSSADLVASLDAHTTGTVEFWVAAGTYSPGSTTTSTFELKKGVSLYGGFAGTENNRTARDWVANPTILSGDKGTASYHVVSSIGASGGTGNPTPTDTRLDGFIITGGNAVGSASANGGGMFNSYASPTVENCTFVGNTASDGGNGGGMHNLNSSPVITNCTFSGNTASLGGGMNNSNSSPVVVNCTFSGNTSTANKGGGMYNLNSSPVVVNTIFWGNTGGTVPRFITGTAAPPRSKIASSPRAER